jgi:ribosomal protein S18 acetylase RimI-like enzyme
MKILEATKDHENEIITLTKTIVEDWGESWSDEASRFLKAQVQAGNAIVAEVDGVFAGFTSYFDSKTAPGFPEKRAHISNTMVNVKFRRKGLAERLKRKLIDTCQKRGVERITTNHNVSNQSIINLSLKLGFREYKDPKFKDAKEIISFELFLK